MFNAPRQPLSKVATEAPAQRPEHTHRLRSPAGTTQTYGGDPPRKFRIFPCMGRNILFKCPRLGVNVQHWLPQALPGDEPNSYRSVVCLACTGLHFIHKETGKLLGETDAGK
jgi:hypothetical protein